MKLEQDKKQDLLEQIHQKKSFLCVGLDPDENKIPQHLKEDPDYLFQFNKQLIDATIDLAVAYKPNIAFFESFGIEGWKALDQIMQYIKSLDQKIFTIADAKRGDIGSSSKKYAETYFEKFDFDSVTVNPYMGKDSVEAFLNYHNKFTILLALTSNDGSKDFQTDGAEPLYEKVLRLSQGWQNSQNLMYVVGATQTEYLQKIRKIIPESFLLIPGVGHQGGNLEEVCKHGLNDQVGLLINASRAINYASSDSDFAEAARDIAKGLQQRMSKFI